MRWHGSGCPYRAVLQVLPAALRPPCLTSVKHLKEPQSTCLEPSATCRREVRCLEVGWRPLGAVRTRFQKKRGLLLVRAPHVFQEPLQHWKKRNLLSSVILPMLTSFAILDLKSWSSSPYSFLLPLEGLSTAQACLVLKEERGGTTCMTFSLGS